MITKLEEADAAMRASGACADWFSGVDEQVWAVAGNCNGRLMEILLRESQHVDPECVFLLRDGVRRRALSRGILARLSFVSRRAHGWQIAS